MKAQSFAYAKPRSLEEALELIGRPGAKILAGGQSLVPTLNMRLSAPELLVDITGLPLQGITLENGVVRIGALATHSQIENSDVVGKHVPLLAQAVKHVAHLAIRNRGTLGGSLALADPAAEYPAVAVALQATLEVVGRNGKRRVAAEKFFKGLFETDLGAAEMVAAVEFPALKKDERSAFLELTRRQGDYAIIGLAAHRAGEARFVYFNAGPSPVLVKGRELNDLKAGLGKLDPPADLYHSSKTKLHLAGVLLERAWTALSKPH